MAPRYMPLQSGTLVTSPYGPRDGGFLGATAGTGTKWDNFATSPAA